MHELDESQESFNKTACACPVEESDKFESLEELWRTIEQLVNPRLFRSVSNLLAMLCAGGKASAVQCTFNRQSSTATVDIQFDEQKFVPVKLIAYDALHLSVPELCIGRRISFELSISTNSLVFMESSGLSAVVIALKGRFRCPIVHLRIDSTVADGEVIQVLATNPLTGETNDSTALIVMRGSLNPQDTTITEQLRCEQITRKRIGAKKLRSTYSGLQALSANPIERVKQSNLVQKLFDRFSARDS